MRSGCSAVVLGGGGGRGLERKQAVKRDHSVADLRKRGLNGEGRARLLASLNATVLYTSIADEAEKHTELSNVLLLQQNSIPLSSKYP